MKTLPAGEHIYFDSPQEPKSVQVVYVSNSGKYLLASFGSASGTSMTPITTVTSPLPVPTIPVAAFPTVTHITPNSGYNGTNITTLTMTGTSFLSGSHGYAERNGICRYFRDKCDHCQHRYQNTYARSTSRVYQRVSVMLWSRIVTVTRECFLEGSELMEQNPVPLLIL